MVFPILAACALQCLALGAQQAPPKRPPRVMVMDGPAINPFALEDRGPAARSDGGPTTDDDSRAAAEYERATRVMEDARREVFLQGIQKNVRLPGQKLQLLDAATGAPLDAEEELDKMAESDAVITGDDFGPFGPGRRERLAEIAGLTPEQAQALWPYESDDEVPAVSAADLAKARKFFGEGGGDGEAMPDALKRLMPASGRERKDQLRRTILTPGEISFACYAAMGFPFPIRVGKIGGAASPPPPNGYVIFNPEIMRADLTRSDFRPRKITYRWMEGRNEVYSAEAAVETYIHLARPTSPVTHLLISSDEDVMAYQLVGMAPPNGIWEVRKTLLNEVIDLHSYLRPPITLYGLRWALLPGIEEITDQPQTRARLGEILQDLGFIKPQAGVPNF